MSHCVLLKVWADVNFKVKGHFCSSAAVVDNAHEQHNNHTQT